LKTASIASLRAHLSRYVEAVRSGEEVIVTDHNKPAARLVPVAAPRRLEGRLAEMARTGLVRLPVRRLPGDFWRRSRPRDATGRSLAILIEVRRGGR